MTTLEETLTRRAAHDPTCAALLAYARSCRNREKRAYAIAYAGWLLLASAPAPCSLAEPRAEVYALSYMGAQAVRIRLGAILRETRGGAT